MLDWKCIFFFILSLPLAHPFLCYYFKCLSCQMYTCSETSVMFKDALNLFRLHTYWHLNSLSVFTVSSVSVLLWLNSGYWQVKLLLNSGFKLQLNEPSHFRAAFLAGFKMDQRTTTNNKKQKWMQCILRWHGWCKKKKKKDAHFRYPKPLFLYFCLFKVYLMFIS